MAVVDQQRLFLFTFILCAGVSYWFYVNLDVEANHVWDPQLVDQKSGERRKPSELLHLTKIINHTSEYIEATNAEERLYDLKYQLDFENPFVIDQHYSNAQEKLVSGWPVANQIQCGAQLNWILTRLVAHSANYTFLTGQLGLELTNLMDSFGRPEANTYAGLVSWLGSYERCLKTSLDGGNIKTRYCEARMRPKWWPRDDATMIPPTRIRLGMCLPETCDTLSLEHHRPAIERLAKFQLPELYKNGLDLMELFCLPDERSPIRQLPLSGRIFLIVVGSWLVLVVAGTIAYECCARQHKIQKPERRRPAANSSVDLSYHQTKTAATTSTFEMSESRFEQDHSRGPWTSLGWELVEAFSLRCSLKAFKSNTFRVRYHLGHRVRVDFGGMDFFKISMILLVVLGHSFYLAITHMRNLAYRVEVNTNEWSRAGMSLSRTVDTFYVFFGALTTYTLMRKLNTSQLGQPIVWLGINLGIFMRVAPLFMLVYWYSRTVSPYTSAGPWWDYGVDKLSMKGVCMHEPWIKSVPYFGQWDNPPVPACNLPSWFIVSYTQIALLLPLVTYLLCRLPHLAHRLCLVGFLSVASALNIGLRMYKQTAVNGEGFTLYGAFLADLMEKFESTGHMSTLGRLCSASIGCLVGYLLRQYELGAIKHLPKWLLSRFTLFALVAAHTVVILLPVFSHWSYLYTKQLMTMEQVVAGNIVVHLIWPILNGLLMLPLGSNHYCHTVMLRFFSHSFWHSFNRLGLCIYLVHWEVIWLTLAGYEQATPNGFQGELSRIWALATLKSVALAFFIHLLFEAPLARITMLMARPFLAGERRAEAELKGQEATTTSQKPATCVGGSGIGTPAATRMAKQKSHTSDTAQIGRLA